jgi:hypothetical protein
MGDDIGIGLFTRQHRGQHDAVVIATRFGPEQGDVIVVTGLEKMLQHAPGGHSCTDDDELFRHALNLLFLAEPGVSAWTNKNAANQHDPDIPRGSPVLLVGGVASYVGARHWTPEYQCAEALAVSIAGSMPN